MAAEVGCCSCLRYAAAVASRSNVRGWYSDKDSDRGRCEGERLGREFCSARVDVYAMTDSVNAPDRGNAVVRIHYLQADAEDDVKADSADSIPYRSISSSM